MTFTVPARSASGRKHRQNGIRSVLTDLSDKTLTANILATLNLATVEEIVAGLGWYSVAHEHATDLHSVPAVGAAVIAACSPQVPWLDNLRIAAAVIAGETPSDCLPLSVDRARLCLAGADPEIVLGGRKVRSFYRNILAPLTAGAVTVDRHAVSIAFGWDLQRNDRMLERCGVYTVVAGAYRAAARSEGLLPQDLQAITWLAHRRILNANDRYGYLRVNETGEEF